MLLTYSGNGFISNDIVIQKVIKQGNKNTVINK